MVGRASTQLGPTSMIANPRGAVAGPRGRSAPDAEFVRQQPVGQKFRDAGFHRKRIGLNHIALTASSKENVDIYFREVLLANGIPTLYQEGPEGDEDYYSVLFEDPDRIKIEVDFAPRYCEKGSWPNSIVSDFDPYAAPKEE